jgi:hypothetical protein
MNSPKTILRTIVGAAILAMFAGNALAATYTYMVESRSGGKNYSQYSDSMPGGGNSTAKSTAAGCTAGIGSRYSQNTGATATYRFTPLQTGTYSVYVTWGNSTNGDTKVHHAVSYEGGIYETDLSQVQGGGGNGVWTKLGDFAFNRGTEYTVVQTNPTIEGVGRLMADTVKWEITGSCYDTPAPTPKPPLMPGTSLTVSGVVSGATSVKVYRFDGSTDVLVGENTTPSVPETTVTLSVTLAIGDVVKVSQVVAGVESCLPLTGSTVGTCDGIPVVQPKPVLANGDATVVVSGVSAGAAAVYVYRDNGGAPLKIGTNAAPPPAGGDVTVTLDSGVTLVNGWTVYATQKLGALEGCTAGAPSIVVGDPGQIGAVTVKGLVDAGRTAIWVDGVTAGASAVRVYANDGTTDTLIGTNSSPTAGRVAVTVAALVAGQKVKAIQQIHTVWGAIPTAGRRVMAAGIIDDFQDGVVQSDNLLPAPLERTWYDVSGAAYSSSLSVTWNSTKWLRVEDAGWTNGAYAVYDAIIPPGVAANTEYHLEMDMIIDERDYAAGSVVDWDLWQSYQAGVVVNGAHRAAGGSLSAISTYGTYNGPLTPAQNGVGIDAVQTVYSPTMLVGAGDNLLIAFANDVQTYNRSKTAVPNVPVGMLIDNVRLVYGPKPCLPSDVRAVNVSAASADGLLVGQTSVKVAGLNGTSGEMASSVQVYEFVAPSTWNLLGSVTSIGGADTTDVTVTALKAHQTIVATQSYIPNSCPGQLTAIEGEKPMIGLVVGTNKNTAVKLSIGVRETNVSTACGAVGSDGGTTGNIEWIGPSSSVSGAPQGKVLSPSNDWQTVTFNPTSDPKLSFNGGNGALNGLCGVLEHLAVAAGSVNDGKFTMYIDNVYSGTTLIEDFEAASAGNTVLFEQPSFSGTTSGNLMPLLTTPATVAPNIATVVDTTGDGSSKSLKIEFQFKDEAASRWVRLTTAAGTTNLRPNPLVSFSDPITLRVLFPGMTCHTPFADADGDGDVDQADFAAFQACFSGPGGGLFVNCDCFDRDDDKDVDSDDAGRFEACASGPGVTASTTCGN